MTTSLKIRRSSVVWLAALFVAATSFGQGFEGKIDMSITDARHPEAKQLIHYTIKDKKMRYDLAIDAKNKSQGSGNVAMIVDGQKREMVTLIDSSDGHGNSHKMAMRHALPDVSEIHHASGEPERERISPPVATGRTEKIAGYTASEYKMNASDGTTTEIWLAQGLGSFMMPQGQNPRNREVPPGWEAFVRRGEFFPLRVVSSNASGTEKMRMEVTKIEKTSVPESLFSTEGYTEVQMPSFSGKGLMQGLLGR